MIEDIQSKEQILAVVQQNLFSALCCLQRKILSIVFELIKYIS